MGITKRFLILSLTIIITIGLSGCMAKKPNDNSLTDNAVRDEMMQFIKNKYKEDFTFVSINTEVWSATYTEMLVEPGAFPGERIPVHKNRETGEMTDGYLPLKINSDLEQIIAPIASQIYGECKVFNKAQTIALPTSYSANMTADEYLGFQAERTNASVFVIGNTADKENDLENFRKELHDKGYYLSFSILYMEQAEFLSVSKENYTGVLANGNILLRGDFIIDDSFALSYKNWR